MPPSPKDWLEEGHLAYFIADVVDTLDVNCFYAPYEGDGRRNSPYDPRMLLKVLVYAYASGVFSSRKIARKLGEDVAFRVLGAGNFPDHRTINRFRQEHVEEFAGIFAQVVKLAREMKLIRMGTLAIDGTKVRANASKHKSMSYGRMKEQEQKLKTEIEDLLRRAQQIDEAEDEKYGADRRGDELPAELARRETRLQKMREAMKAIEAEAKDKAARKAAEEAREQGANEEEARARGEAAREAAVPKGSAQRNFTDPESRMMKTTDGFHYGYNAQTVVDEEAQVILAQSVSNLAADAPQLMDMIDATTKNLGAADIDDDPDTVIADAGYFSEANVTNAIDAGTDILIATGRMKDADRVSQAPRGPIPRDATVKQKMARRLRTKAGRADYARRKAIVEPVFGQMKVRQHAGFLRLRGLDGAQGEWALHTLCHNLRKLAHTG